MSDQSNKPSVVILRWRAPYTRQASCLLTGARCLTVATVVDGGE